MVEEFETKYPLHKEPVPTPCSNNLFNVNESPKLDQTHLANYHTYVAKGRFTCRQAWLDIQLPISFLSTHIKEPTEHDWIKLHHMMKFIHGLLTSPILLSSQLMPPLPFIST